MSYSLRGPPIARWRGSEASPGHPRPRTLDGDALAPAALQAMEENRITSVFICDPDRRLDGVVHIHDLWRLELF